MEYIPLCNPFKGERLGFSSTSSPSGPGSGYSPGMVVAGTSGQGSGYQRKTHGAGRCKLGQHVYGNGKVCPRGQWRVASRE